MKASSIIWGGIRGRPSSIILSLRLRGERRTAPPGAAAGTCPLPREKAAPSRRSASASTDAAGYIRPPPQPTARIHDRRAAATSPRGATCRCDAPSGRTTAIMRASWHAILLCQSGDSRPTTVLRHGFREDVVRNNSPAPLMRFSEPVQFCLGSVWLQASSVSESARVGLDR